jgi:hypothetical protein
MIRSQHLVQMPPCRRMEKLSSCNTQDITNPRKRTCNRIRRHSILDFFLFSKQKTIITNHVSKDTPLSDLLPRGKKQKKKPKHKLSVKEHTSFVLTQLRNTFGISIEIAQYLHMYRYAGDNKAPRVRRMLV